MAASGENGGELSLALELSLVAWLTTAYMNSHLYNIVLKDELLKQNETKLS